MANPLRTSNPALNEKAFRGEVAVGGEAMTLQGTVNKTGVLLLCVVATAGVDLGSGAFGDAGGGHAVDDRRVAGRNGDRAGDDIQEKLGTDHRAAVRAAGRIGAWRHLGDV